MSLVDIIAALETEAATMQAEIDRMIDAHGAIGRALTELRGQTVTVAVTGLAPITATLRVDDIASVDQALDAIEAAHPTVLADRQRSKERSASEKAALAEMDDAARARQILDERKGKPVAKAGEPKASTGRDYGPIAAWINAAKADGTYSQAALAAHFGESLSTVKNWVVACKQRGLLTNPTPSPVEAKAARDAAKAEPAPAGPVADALAILDQQA